MTDPAMGPWAILLGVLTAVGTVIVGIYTARSARAANRETSQLGSWRDMVNVLQEDVQRIRAQRQEEDQRYRMELDSCDKRINSLADKVAAAERREQALVSWARRVIQLMQTVEVEFPPPPMSVHDTGPNRAVER